MKRYPKYKDSGIEWIGAIPEHWVVSKLKYSLDEIIGGGTPDTSNSSYWDDENGIPWVAISDITEQEILKKTSRKISVEGKESKGLEIIPRGTLLISIFASLGKTTLLDIDASANQAILGLIPAHKLIRDYLKYHLVDAERYISYYSSSNTQENLNLTKIKNLSVLLPPFPEQQTIVTYLDRKTHLIDTLIEKKQKLIDLLKEQRAAIINQAVTKGLNPNVKQKDSGIEWLGEIPEHWDVKKLKWVVKERLKYGANESAELDDKKLPRYIRITDFDEDGRLRAETFRSLPFEKAEEYLLKEGDILFARSGATVGKTFQFKNYEGVACFAGYLIKATVNEKVILSDYLYLYTKSNRYKNWKNRIFIQATIQNIGADKYQMLEVTIPPLNEQKNILNYVHEKLKKIQRIYNKTVKQIDLLKEYRTALISEVVTGKIDVRDSGEQEVIHS